MRVDFLGFSEKGSFQSEFVARLKLDLRERQVVYALRPAKINVTCPQRHSAGDLPIFFVGCVFPKNLAARVTDIHSLWTAAERPYAHQRTLRTQSLKRPTR